MFNFQQLERLLLEAVTKTSKESVTGGNFSSLYSFDGAKYFMLMCGLRRASRGSHWEVRTYSCDRISATRKQAKRLEWPWKPPFLQCWWTFRKIMLQFENVSSFGVGITQKQVDFFVRKSRWMTSTTMKKCFSVRILDIFKKQGKVQHFVWPTFWIALPTPKRQDIVDCRGTIFFSRSGVGPEPSAASFRTGIDFIALLIDGLGVDTRRTTADGPLPESSTTAPTLFGGLSVKRTAAVGKGVLKIGVTSIVIPVDNKGPTANINEPRHRTVCGT